MRTDLNARGPLNSPILIVGDSLPENEDTQSVLDEILDRRGVIYNSIIIPLKYYMNEYLLANHSLKLPFESPNDIFRYVNAVDDPNDKKGLNPADSTYQTKILKLRNEIFDSYNKNKYRLILCMGDFSYFAVRSLFGIYHSRENHYYRSSGTKYEIYRLGEFFHEGILKYSARVNNILPILHNSSNLFFSKTSEFIPSQRRNSYKCYLQYVAEEIAELMLSDELLKAYLITV